MTPRADSTDDELAEVVARMRRVRRRNRLAHVAACATLVITASTVWCVYAYGLQDAPLSGRVGRIGMLLSAATAVFATVVVHGRLKSKESETDDV